MTSHFKESEFKIIDYFIIVAALSSPHSKHKYVFLSLCFIGSNLMSFVLFKFYKCFKRTRRVGLGVDDENRPKRCQTRRLGSKYVFFFLFVFFIHLLKISILFRFYQCFKRTGGLGWAARTKTGPNNPKYVVFFFLGVLLYSY